MEITDFKQIYITSGKETIVPTSADAGYDSSDTYIYKTKFSIKNISIALANSLRRSFSTLAPTITFETDSINIIENTTPIHNEFLCHRIELVPIFTDNSVAASYCKIKTTFDQESLKRKWDFLNSDKVPEFTINTKLAKTILTENITMNNIRDITTESFTIKDMDGNTLSNSNFFKKDVYTNDPILINCIKTKVYEEGHRTDLHLTAIPVVSIGKIHTRNDPTGTVEYQFKLDSDENIEKIWVQKLEYLKNERKLNGLTTYSDKELKQLKTSFDLLDKYRVFETDDEGRANHFEFSIESIGFMSSNTIIYDSAKHLELCFDDLIRNILFKKHPIEDNKYIVDRNFSNKITIQPLSTSNINEGCSIIIKDENHTVGNLIQDKLRKKYLAKSTSESGKYLKLANYRMDHPTIEEIEIILSLHDKVTNTVIDGLLNNYISDKFGDGNKIHVNKTNRRLYFSVYLLVEALKDIKQDISKFLKLFSTKSNITEASYEIIS